jgi:hypothetical protein
MVDEEKSTGLLLAEKLEKMAKVMEGMNDSPTLKRMLILYIHDKTRVAKGSIELTLDAIDSFSKEFKGG